MLFISGTPTLIFVVDLVACLQTAEVLRARFGTDHPENLPDELWRRCLPASSDIEIPKQHPLHQSAA